jgi:HEAT repeat protein
VWHRHNRAPEEEVRRERATWWQEWWARHRDGTRLDWLMEPLTIEKYRSDACVALGNLDDPRAIPILVRLLDDGAREVRLYAANGLLRRKYEGRRYAGVNYPELAQDEEAVMAEAREWARSHGPQADGAAKPAAPADTEKSPR